MTYSIILGRNEQDRKLFGEDGTIFLGKSYVKMGQTTSLSNEVYLDIARSHVVFIAGKRGSGKCLLGDTMITLEDGSLVPIKNLEDVQQKVLGLDSALKIVPMAIGGFFKRMVNEVLHVKTRSGREITLTPEHPLFTIKGWVSAEKLPIGSRIATPRQLPSCGCDDMDEAKVKMLAYLIAEGHICQSWVLFSNSDPTIVDEFKNSVKKFNPNLEIRQHSKPGCYRVCNLDNRYTFRPNPVKLWLKTVGIYGKLSPEKFIPCVVFRLPRDKLILFLNRLFSCDGSIYYDPFCNGWEISYSSSSKLLASQVQNLLLRFGILAKLRKKNIKYKGKMVISYELVLNRENCIHFINEIGFFGTKAETATRCLVEIQRIHGNPNVDTVPKEIWETYRPQNWAAVGRAIGYAYPKAMRERMQYAPSRDTLLKIAQVERHKPLELLATADIFWDEIISMEKIEGEFQVYDISVPEYHNFVANDIIVHNSYSSSVVTEGMLDLPVEVSKNIAVILLDTMGVYWTMKYPNEKDAALLEKWGLQPRGFSRIKIFTPFGHFAQAQDAGIPTDAPFSLKASELTGEDWRLAFELDMSHPVSILIEKILGDFSDNGVKDYNIEDIQECITKDPSFSSETKNDALNRFHMAKRWGLFSPEGTGVDTLIHGGTASVLDLSAYTFGEGGWGVKSLVVGLVVRKVFVERMRARQEEEVQAVKTGYSYFRTEESSLLREKKPMVWFVLDEAHEFLPAKGKTAATDALVAALREGRQPGISLLLISQQPGKIHSDVLTQSDIVLAHRLTARKDISALNSMMQSYLGDTLDHYLTIIPPESGAAIVLDDNSERLYPIQVRPKFSWHGGEAPSALHIRRRV